MSRVLIIDDDVAVGQSIATVVERQGHEAVLSRTAKEALERTQNEAFDVVFLDVRLPDGNGLDLLPKMKVTPSNPEVIIMTGFGDPDGAELAIKNGAWDYLEKPASVQKTSLPLVRALEYRERKEKAEREAPAKALDREGIVGDAPLMKAAIHRVAEASAGRADVLITGETGTGKEVFARAIHKNSRRTDGPFVVVDCAALPENLVESALFGHERGAFTGANGSREGLVAQADGGTLFLDEVGELPHAIQKSFLRVLQEKRFRRVGGDREESSDFRLIAATNRDIEAMVEKGTFRRDLLFRLQAFKLELPPLRGRRRDIRSLAHHYVPKICARYEIPSKGFSPEFLSVLANYHWPGNVRELIQALEKAVASALHEPVLFPAHLPTRLRVAVKKATVGREEPPKTPSASLAESVTAQISRNRPSSLDEFPPIKEVRAETIAKVETQYLQDLMALANGDIARAIEVSGLSRSRLYTLLKKHQVPTSS